MKKNLPLLLFGLCAMISAVAQDRIYMIDDQRKDAIVTAITSDKIRFKADGIFDSVPRNRVKLIFKKNGEFISIPNLENDPEAETTIKDFLTPAVKRTYKVDRIFMVYNQVIAGTIHKEDDTYLYYKNVKEDDRVAKPSVAVIIYANGTHKVLASLNMAATAMMPTHTQLADDMVEAKLTAAEIRANAQAIAEPKMVVPKQARQDNSEAITKTEEKKADDKKAEEVKKEEVVKTEDKKADEKKVEEVKNDQVVKSEEKRTEDKKVEEVKKDEVVKPVEQPKKEEPKKEEPKVEAPKKTTASLMIMAPKAVAIAVTLNDAPLGNIKATEFRKTELVSGTYKIVMDDKQGNVITKDITIDPAQYGEVITVNFPEIDYAAIKEQKRQENLAVLKGLEASITDQLEKILSNKELLNSDSTQILKGQKELDEVSDKLLTNYNDSRTQLQTLLSGYNETAASMDLKEAIKPFLAKIIKDNTKATASTYAQNIRSGKKAMSSDLSIALKRSRAADLKFFVKKETIAETEVEGYPILSYALKINADASVIQELVNMGAPVSSFAKRLESNGKIYESPLAIAAANKNAANIKVLLNAGAKLFPPFIANKEKRMQVKYVMQFVKDKPEIITMMEASGLTMVDYEALLKKAVDELVGNMVSVEGGTFMIGCIPDVRVSCLGSETPAKEVKISSFNISKFEVTRAQWAAIMEEDNVPGVKECPSCPMSPVTYEMAVNYILKLNEISGKKFRLPTEAEWEFASMGGTKATQKPKFSGAEESNDVAWTSENSGGQLHPVGEKKPNALGLYDMSGNVAEWCSSWFLESYYTQIPNADPKGPDSGSSKVIRGGSYLQSNFSARVTRRWGEQPPFLNPGVGFRLVLDN